MRVLVTGSAGFIGFHTCRRLLEAGHAVQGIDNLNPYYDVRLKEARAALCVENPNFTFIRADVCDRDRVFSSSREFSPTHIIHLAAQAGVRYSIENPRAYIDTNLVGFSVILEVARELGVRHLVYASSSSVYGANRHLPFSVKAHVDHPISLYAATKRSNELLAHSYSHLFRIPTTALRFFTVYGPWGRPDMALFLFTRAILDGREIVLYNEGHMSRDFTYIDDIVDGILAAAEHPPTPDAAWNPEVPNPDSSTAPFRIYNLGNGHRVDLLHFIRLIERATGRTAKIRLAPMQAGDVSETLADITESSRDLGFAPKISTEVGVPRFIEWYLKYYHAS